MPPSYSAALFLFLLLLAAPLPPTAAAKRRHASTTATSSYRHISWASNLTLLGSASILPGAVAVALTTNTSDGIGAGRALFSEPVRFLLPPPDPRAGSPAHASFSTRFTFRIAPSPSYGDGLAFILTSSRTFLGASNGFLGLYPSASASDDGELADVSTVAVELDTHRDVALRDPAGNHVALDAGSIFSVASASPGVDLKAGVPITAWVEYRAPRRRLRAWLSYSSARRPDKPALSVDVDLSGLLRAYMYAGFSASNGQGSALHVVESWTFRTFGFPNYSHASASPIPSPPPNDLKSPLPLPTNHHHHHHLFYKVLGGVLGGVVLLAIVVISSILWLAHAKGRKSEGPDVPFEDKNFRGVLPMEVVRAATKDFGSENVIGIGGSGAIVFEGVLPSGTRVAAKRFQAMRPCSRAFESELRAMLDCPHHPNLVPLFGWCSSEHDMVLVYEFMPNGNLDSALHTQGGATLPWEARFGAVLGVASALTFLHDECEHRILHRDVKSSNVLLDADFNARLGDFGLARVVSHGGVPLATQPAGTLGYLAPEYVHSGVASERSDVYSFGVLALEVATGRRPTEKGTAVVDWVWGLWGRRRLVDAADQRLQGRFVAEEMRRVLLVGLCCVHPDCRKRPGMRRVVRMLDGTAPMTLVPDKKPPVVLKSPLNQTSSMNTVDTKNTAFYSCREAYSTR